MHTPRTEDQQVPSIPRLLAQPTAFPVGDALMAAVVLAPYGGAGQAEIDTFPSYASLTPLDQEAPMTSPWCFWDDGTGAVTLAFDKPGEPGAVEVIMELDEPPALWWDLARGRAQLVVVWLPHLRHPTTEEMLEAINTHSGWMASARRVPTVRFR
ncbi:hypothetical protein GCM10009738_67050 [Kitasatospora viridis]|uniref:Uncharacterized protein n=2 Tax=Kitasatospora viridis TaxID=281105 RepID=A0A561SA48_9ACTN|nr:hypothetical protein FHX73_18124 [Kitasatospora viridis]